MEVTRVTWKISVLGALGAGKSSIISRMIYDSDGSAAQPRSIQKKTLSFLRDGKKVIADLLFLELDEGKNNEKLIMGSNAIIVVCDLTDFASLTSAESTFKNLRKFNSKSLTYLVATKLDRKYEAAYWTDELDRISGRDGIKYFLASSRTGEGVGDLINSLTSNLIERFLGKKEKNA
ncbi:MAG: GTPase domain-containing protein [Candidatus Thermoplasmatota archaeon]|jgi:GTPase SAR1 family protein|nr:GTPase domain-containing protein [Candidatus Thermoplasmatota archaeon]MCL5793230.1 GTPase domain-containing protein [Candidatus Thermoplasmatota archaeon]